jgi:hypothetical protein
MLSNKIYPPNLTQLVGFRLKCCIKGQNSKIRTLASSEGGIESFTCQGKGEAVMGFVDTSTAAISSL